MKLELKKIKIHNDMSDETTAFSAELWLDGKKAFFIKNDGCGGSHYYDRIVGCGFEFEDLNKYAKDKYPSEEFEVVDHMIDEMINDYEENKQLKGWCKRKLVFRLKGDAKGIYNTVPMLTPFNYSKELGIAHTKKYGDLLEEIINERFL